MAVIMGSLLLIGVAGPVRANHMLSNPPMIWDADNNGIADTTGPKIDADGGGWNQTKLDRLNEATDEWNTDTQFNPTREFGTGPNKVYIDGTFDGACGTPPSGALAVTCVHYTNKTTQGGFTYRDISQAITGFAILGSPFFWWYGLAHSGDENSVDFGGVITHEIGHWVHLIDVYGSGCNYGTSMYTMCGAPQNGSTIDDDTWRQRGLTTHDITAANTLY